MLVLGSAYRMRFLPDWAALGRKAKHWDAQQAGTATRINYDNSK